MPRAVPRTSCPTVEMDVIICSSNVFLKFLKISFGIEYRCIGVSTYGGAGSGERTNYSLFEKNVQKL